MKTEVDYFCFSFFSAKKLLFFKNKQKEKQSLASLSLDIM